jgi:hypothetical protein
VGIVGTGAVTGTPVVGLAGAVWCSTYLTTRRPYLKISKDNSGAVLSWVFSYSARGNPDMYSDSRRNVTSGLPRRSDLDRAFSCSSPESLIGNPLDVQYLV